MPKHQSKETFFQYHVFVCTNHRDELMSCTDFGAVDARAYLKAEVKKRGLARCDKSGAAMVRINQAGCLGRCLSGPVIAVYPQGVWYTYVDERDLDEILERHLQKGEVVERLLIGDARA